MIARLAELFKSSPEAAIVAVYGLVHLVLLLARKVVVGAKVLLRELGVRWRRNLPREIIMHRTIVNARGQVTIPAELRKQLKIKPGTRITWFEEKGRLILAPMTSRA